MKIATDRNECRKICEKIYESGKGEIVDVIISNDEIIIIYKDE